MAVNSYMTNDPQRQEIEFICVFPNDRLLF